jgi:hypothetical protein
MVYDHFRLVCNILLKMFCLNYKFFSNASFMGNTKSHFEPASIFKGRTFKMIFIIENWKVNRSTTYP